MSHMLSLPIALLLSSMISFNSASLGNSEIFPTLVESNQTLSQHTISMANRYPSPGVNDIFKFNILLNTVYLSGQSFAEPRKLGMADVDKPLNYSFSLKPGETFAFHDRVFDKYEGKVTITSNSQFNAKQGFKSDGYLYGDGVCHLASLLNWVASDAGLQVEAPANHDFRPIPDIPKQYGTAILYSGNKGVDARENLYITNTKDKEVKITLNYQNQNLEAKVEEVN